MIIPNLSDTELKALQLNLTKQDWDRQIALTKKKDRHKTIDFTNKRHETLMADIKQEIAKRGL